MSKRDRAAKEYSDYGLEICPPASAELRARIRQGVKALPPRGVEISGLFVGQTEARLSRIEALVPIASSDYTQGPTFCADRRAIDHALSHAGALGQIVGIYRSRTDGVLDLDQQDQLLLQSVRWSSGPLAIVIVRPAGSIHAEARTGFWDGSKMEWSDGLVFLKDWLKDSGDKAESLVPTTKRRSLKTAAAVIVGLAGITFLLWPAAAERPNLSSPVGEIVNTPRAVFGSAPMVPERARVVEEPRRQPAVSNLKSAAIPQAPVIPASTSPDVRAARMFIPPAAKPSSHPNESDSALSLPPVPQIATAPSQSLPPVAVPSSAVRVPGFSQPMAFTPPVLTQRTTPIVIPTTLRKVMTGDVMLSFHLTIDASGRVTAVDQPGGRGKLEDSLWAACQPSVRNWRFQPARQNGVPTSAKTVLHIRLESGRK